MIVLSGVIISLFLVLLLFGKQRKAKADTILLIWLAVTCFHLLLSYLYITGLSFSYPFVLVLDIPLPLAQAPFILLYTEAITSQKSFRIHPFCYFFPAIIVYTAISGFFLLPSAEKIVVYQQHGKGYEWITTITLLASMVSGIVYVALSSRLLLQHRKSILQQFSYTEKINLNWLRYLIWGMAGIWTIVIFQGETSHVFTAVSFYVIFIGFFGIRQVGIFTNVESFKNIPFKTVPVSNDDNGQATAPDEIEEDLLIPKYQKGLSPEAIGEIYTRLSALMRDEKLYKDADLSLTSLATRMDVHPNFLSQAINSLSGNNFYDYINQQRVEEFKAMISSADNRKFTLLAIALDCGFNSKTSFNRNFKKVTGVSPTEYIKGLGF